MPFSINNAPFIKNDALALDSKPSKGPDVGTTLSMSGAGFGHTPSAPKTEFSATLQRDGFNNAGVLTKLFDMFDQLISAMREMFSGKAEIASQRSPADSSVLAKPDAGVPIGAPAHTKLQVKDSSFSEAQSKSKLEEGSQQKDAAVAGAQSKATLQTGQPLKNTTAVETQTKNTLDESSQHKDVHVAGVHTKERLPVGVLSKVISDVANQLKKKSSEDSHQAETRAPGLRVLPQAREPGIYVTTEANPQIKVEINVNHCHCHCPETSGEAGKESRAIAGVASRTNAPLPPEKRVLTDSVEGHLKSVITEGKDSKLVTEAKDSHVESTKTDDKDGEHDSDHLTGPRRSGDEVAESDTSGSRETTSQVTPRTKVGVTSPGPAENESDRWNQGFSNRSRLRS